MDRSTIDRYQVRFTPRDTSPSRILPAWRDWARIRGVKSWPDAWAATGVLDRFLVGGQALADVTGMQWAITSDFRDSPSHAHGGAVDLAPVPSDWSRYALSKGMDPLLNGRPQVLRDAGIAADRASRIPAGGYRLIWCIEDDHIHAHVVRERGNDTVFRVPWRTHPGYRSGPHDEACRVDPSLFKPRF